jgi:hypothetical protein
MKKLFAYLLGGTLFIASCTEDQVSNETASQNSETFSRMCASMEVLDAQLKADPTLRSRMEDIESNSRRAISSGRLNALGKIEIPVVVNVIYRTAAENISDAQIQSQIDVLNEDFHATNADVTKTPAIFSGLVANIDVQFVLVAINRKSSTKRSWSVNDAMKKSSQGGINPTNPTENLNIWIVNRMTSGGSTILGYAQFPGGPASTDGVVIGYNFFGRVGTLSPPFDKGRTATHEVGHWMNLRHIWGDATCGNDLVSDTPQHNTANYGCPSSSHRSTCSGTPIEMTMNYMDYTDDACMYMFSTGQKQRALSIFASGGPRASFGD